MTPQHIRLEILKMLRLQDIASPDVLKAIERAKALEAYVIGEGQAKAPPPQAVTQAPQVRNNQPVAGPAYRK